MSKKSRLILYLSVLLVAGFSLTSLFSYQVSRTAVHDGIVRSQLPLVGDNVYSEIQRDLLRPVFISSVMAQDAFLRDWVLDGERDERQIRRYLAEIKSRYQTVTSFYVSENTGHYYHASGILKTVQPDDPIDAWYYRAREMTSDFEINVDLDAANANAMTIFVNYKMFDYDGQFIGVTGVGLTVHTVGKMIDHYQNRFQRRIYFVDGDGQVVLPTAPESANSANIRNMAGLSPHAARILSEKSTSLRYDQNGDTNFIATRFIPELDWTLIVEQSDAEPVAALRHALLINLAISLLVTVVVLALTLLAINKYSKALLTSAVAEKDSNQRLSRLNRQKDKVLSIIGHDLRAPFTAFLGIAELLKLNSAKMTAEEVSAHASDVLKAGRRAYDVLENLLEWAQVQWEDLKPEPEVIDIVEIIDNNVDLFSTLAKQKNISLSWSQAGPVQVHADKNMVDLVVRNLLDNAVKFTRGGGTVSVVMEQGPAQVWVSVRDTGVGMAPGLVASLMASTPITSTPGTSGEVGIGMGLSLCREMLEVNGGELQIESTPGSGSEFRFFLPRA